MNVIPVLKYLFGLAVFGFLYWILDGILTLFIAEGVHTSGTTWNIMHMFWTGSLIIYMIFGGWWVIRTYNEKTIYGGGF